MALLLVATPALPAALLKVLQAVLLAALLEVLPVVLLVVLLAATLLVEIGAPPLGPLFALLGLALMAIPMVLLVVWVRFPVGCFWWRR